MSKSILSFPNPVNEVASRWVAGCVAVICVAAILTQQPWVSAVLAYGFLARVAAGPTLSPLGQLATRVLAPRLARRAKLVPGPPKRFAQGIGAALTVAATILLFGFRLSLGTYALLGMLAIAATLESVFALCLGCRLFSAMMRIGLIPPEVCAACSNINGPAAEALRARSGA
ncbi:MAG: DUF4395 domain-containing protein [Candidatus Dormibacteraeota bacterium]|nr:DUF4395 domain-containing protein [Candidatus Dormibacteraeota bacterium]